MMKQNRNNLFIGDSYCTLFACSAYKLLKSRKRIGYIDVMLDVKGKKNVEELKVPLTKREHYSDLKKAFPKVINAIRDRMGIDAIEETGTKRDKSFRYVGHNDDPLADLWNYKFVNDLKQYWQFCQDSAGFFPSSWVEYFFKDCMDLLEMRRRREKGERVLTSSMDRSLKNIDMLPFLYEAIINKKVLCITYKPFNKASIQLIFHPQYLREYNGRWHLFGHAEGEVPEWTYDIAIDRIEELPKEQEETAFMSAPSGYYDNFFCDKVGVSQHAGIKAVDVHIRAHSPYMFSLVETKRLHHSQLTTVPYGNHGDGSYGEFKIHVEVNNEFIGSVLQLGADLEVVAPDDVRQLFAERIEAMQKMYQPINHPSEEHPAEAKIGSKQQ